VYGTPLIPLLTLSSAWLSAGSKLSSIFYLQSAIYSDESKKDTDPWYQFSGTIDEFNLIHI